MVVREVEEKLLDTEQDVGLAEHLELDHLADEPADLDLGLDVDLVLFPDVPAKVLEIGKSSVLM